MEHSIYFNNDSANNNISTALAELDDTFLLKIQDNSNTTYLSNFEYIDNPNNYIKDKVYEDLKLKFESLDKNIRDMVIKGQLLAFQKDENTNKVNTTNRKYLRFNYCYNNSLPICRATYEALVGVSHSYIDSMIQHLKKHGLEERIHAGLFHHLMMVHKNSPVTIKPDEVRICHAVILDHT
ncbi:14401_t:CDS:2 [Cetraspora pellucida]|uniref:14401_t:CDS:1 n=1 Tax=Cetraspora pellucida TaxID=1433469 RepID=A0A9N8WKQ9_9GLOM|nr:14401_t:CDS:2 [Cetraspora pellucida]